MTQADMAAIRAEQLALLWDSCTIQRNMPADDGMGGEEPSWAQVGAAVACRIAAATGATEGQAGAAMRGAVGYTLTLPYGTDLRRKDRVVIDAKTYEVIGLLSSKGWASAVRAQLVLVT